MSGTRPWYLMLGWLVALLLIYLLLRLVVASGFVLSGDHADKWLPAITWPAVTLIGLLVLKRPFTMLCDALGPRITKVSLFKIDIELTKAEQLKSVSTASLDDIRDLGGVAAIESGRGLFRLVESTTPLDFAVVALGEGKEWITSRLFIATAMLRRMHGIKAVVFTEGEQKYLGWATPEEIMGRLAIHSPWLRRAYIHAEHNIAPDDVTQMKQYFTVKYSMNGALDPNQAASVVSNYLTLLKSPPPAGIPTSSAQEGWLQWGNGQFERAEWLTSSLLVELLGSDLNRTEAMIDSLDDSPEVRLGRVLRRPGKYVAIEDHANRFLRLVDRGQLLEKIAQENPLVRLGSKKAGFNEAVSE